MTHPCCNTTDIHMPNIAVKLSSLEGLPEETVTILFGAPNSSSVFSTDGDPLCRIGSSVPRQVVEPWSSIKQIVEYNGLLQPFDLTIIDWGQGEYPIMIQLHIRGDRFLDFNCIFEFPHVDN